MIVSRILIRDVKLPEVAAFVGIDWADQKHDVVLRSVGDPTKVEHGYWGAMEQKTGIRNPVQTEEEPPISSGTRRT